MPTRLAIRVPPADTLALSRKPAPDWECLRTLLEVVRYGSFRAMAKSRSVPINTIRREIARLEYQVGSALLLRSPEGVQITPEGERLVEIARKMEEVVLGLDFPVERGGSRKLEGEVKVAITEGLGTFWLVPRFVEFQRAFPKLLIDLHCTMREADLLRFEAHVALQIRRPSNPDLKLQKVGTLHVMPFASPDYLQRFGQPRDKSELLEHHRIVLLEAEQGDGRAFYDHEFPGKEQIGFIAVRSNTTAAHAWAVAKGAGIGWLPSYAKACGGNVVPLDLDMRFRLDMWLTYNPSAARLYRVRRMIDWIAENCSPRQFPWFRDEFIHPNEFERLYQGPPLINVFGGFQAGGEDAGWAVNE